MRPELPGSAPCLEAEPPPAVDEAETKAFAAGQARPWDRTVRPYWTPETARHRRTASRPRLPSRPQSQTPPWLLSYADLMSLLLVLFIFLSGTGRFPLASTGDHEEPLESFAPLSGLAPGDFQALEAAAIPDVEALLAGAPLLASVFFERGSGELTEEARARLTTLASTLRRSRRPLVALGHASPLVGRQDPLPALPTVDLAFARALAVADFLEGLNDSNAHAPRLELIAGSAGHHHAAREGLGPDLHDARDRVDVFPLGVPRRMP